MARVMGGAASTSTTAVETRDLKPLIGSEVKADLDALISGTFSQELPDGDLVNNDTIDLTDGDTAVTVIGTVSNNGTIDLSGGGADDSLTIVGDVTGDGIVIIDAVITDTGDASDSMVIDGSLGGSVETVINNTGGPVTEPPQPGSGITLITASEGVTADLTINAPFEYVAVGPWRYELATPRAVTGMRSSGVHALTSTSMDMPSVSMQAGSRMPNRRVAGMSTTSRNTAL